MRYSRIVAALGMLSFVATAAHADLSASVTATSDYVFRGISQTKEDPALQASLDYSHSSGWYIGAWGTNIDFGPDDPADMELDIYTGFAGETATGLGWDVGLLHYTYPGASDYNFLELYGKLSYGLFSGGLAYSNDWANSGEDAFYVSGGVSVPFASNFTFNLNANYSFGDAFDDTEYMDYMVGIGYTLGSFELGLSYIDTTLDRGDALFSDADLFNTEGRVVFSVSTTFPWSTH